MQKVTLESYKNACSPQKLLVPQLSSWTMICQNLKTLKLMANTKNGKCHVILRIFLSLISLRHPSIVLKLCYIPQEQISVFLLSVFHEKRSHCLCGPPLVFPLHWEILENSVIFIMPWIHKAKNGTIKKITSVSL